MANGATLTIQAGHQHRRATPPWPGSSLWILRGVQDRRAGHRGRPHRLHLGRGPPGNRKPGDWGGSSSSATASSTAPATDPDRGSRGGVIRALLRRHRQRRQQRHPPLRPHRVRRLRRLHGAGQELNTPLDATRWAAAPRYEYLQTWPAWTTPSSGGAARSMAGTSSPTSRATTTSTGPRATAAATSS